MDGRNHLLQELTLKERRPLFADLTRVEIASSEVLPATSERHAHVYFPTGAVLASVCASNGAAVEVRGVGIEGMLGLAALHAAEHPRFELACQIGGTLLRMPASAFVQHLARDESLRRIIARYSTNALTFMTQSVACNGLHSVARRCARYLLTTGDRSGSETFALTHDLLARMLGVRRAGVSVAVSRLQRLGAVRYRLGAVTIIDRMRLEDEACECYGIITREHRRTKGRPRT